MKLTPSCWIGPLKLHTLNFEKDECIWCGPNKLAWKSGKWIDIGNNQSAWSINNVERRKK